MLDFLYRIFGRENQSSSRVAKERLRLVLVHDRASVSSSVIEDIKEDIIQVISKYMEIEENGLEVSFDKSDNSVALVANIPIRRMRRETVGQRFPSE